MIYINEEKISKIKLEEDNFFVAIDFDKTITARKCCDSWGTCESVLGEEFTRKTELICQKYAPIELNYEISFDEKNKAMEEWYYSNMQLFYDYHLTKAQLEESIENSTIIFRDGAKEFLKDMFKRNIPVVILSAGIGNVIELFLKKNNCYTDNIYIISNFIKFDNVGNMNKPDVVLIHTLNKTMKNHITPEFEEKISKRKYRLLLGDFIEDKNMISKEEWDETIAIRILRYKCSTKSGDI